VVTLSTIRGLGILKAFDWRQANNLDCVRNRFEYYYKNKPRNYYRGLSIFICINNRKRVNFKLLDFAWATRVKRHSRKTFSYTWQCSFRNYRRHQKHPKSVNISLHCQHRPNVRRPTYLIP